MLKQLKEETLNPLCEECGEPFAKERAKLGYSTCLKHGDKRKIFTVVPMHKSNYIPVFNRELLVGINNKTVR